MRKSLPRGLDQVYWPASLYLESRLLEFKRYALNRETFGKKLTEHGKGS